MLLLLEDLAELPGSTWRVRRKEQRGGWHQSCPGRLSEDNWAFDTKQRAAGESTRVQSTEPKHLQASNSVESTDEREENAIREHKETRYLCKSAQISFAP